MEGKCAASGCPERTTHILTTKVLATSDMPEMIREFKYCLEHALYFAAWLPYCYPGKYELISITPPVSELFS